MTLNITAKKPFTSYTEAAQATDTVVVYRCLPISIEKLNNMSEADLAKPVEVEEVFIPYQETYLMGNESHPVVLVDGNKHIMPEVIACL